MLSPRAQSPQRLILSVLLVSAVCSKLLHIYQHRSLPIYLIALFFPTFFIQDVLLLLAVRFVLHRTTGWWAVAGFAVSTSFAALNLVATASQFSFFYKTGAEIRWDAALSVGSSGSGLKLILSGLVPTVVAASVIFALSCVASSWVHALVNRWLTSLALPVPPAEALPLSEFVNFRSYKSLGGLWPGALSAPRLWTTCVCTTTLLLWLVQPSVPYSHISEALPFVIFLNHASAITAAYGAFPFKELLNEAYFEPEDGHAKGWSPGLFFQSFDRESGTMPSWTQGSLPPGFERWRSSPKMNTSDTETDASTSLDHFYYDPAQDHMRISNFDLELLSPLKETLRERDVVIDHVVFVFLESCRKDLFPLKVGSRLHQQIIDSHGTMDEAKQAALHEHLALLTPVAEMLTGETTGFEDALGRATKRPKPLSNEFGGINVDGMMTGSTLSAKARLVNYCGVGPLPVDLMQENGKMPYQPCLMQIFELFNRRKNETTSRQATALERQWHNVYAQSVTGKFQRQFEMMEMLGFTEAIYSEDIEDPKAEHFHEGMERVNYFGYSENEVRPYIRDAINRTLSANKRLFLSHFTSSTHHPWGTPANFPREKYFGGVGDHGNMNRFLNAIRFVDTWLAGLLSMLDEAGIANETLTIFVGDHGQAFSEDSSVSGTYNNPHISNFHVPLLFHHPLLPRLHVTANASTASIVPTILDLLVHTGSLDDEDSQIALDLINQYEAQSLIRPFRASHHGREAWNMGVINAGGTMLSVGSAAVPYRLIFPLASDVEYRFTNLESDPYELSPILAWTLTDLHNHVASQHSWEAAQWVMRAAKMSEWWLKKQRKLWNLKDEMDKSDETEAAGA